MEQKWMEQKRRNRNGGTEMNGTEMEEHKWRTEMEEQK